MRARRRGLRVAFSPAVARWVAQRGFHPDSGARELRLRVVGSERQVLTDFMVLLTARTMGFLVGQRRRDWIAV